MVPPQSSRRSFGQQSGDVASAVVVAQHRLPRELRQRGGHLRDGLPGRVVAGIVLVGDAWRYEG
jgi:hypothetical protein